MYIPLPEISDAQRKLFHSVLADWMLNASESDFEILEKARHELYPGEICSLLKLIRRCFAVPDLVERLPASLVKLLRERNWLRPFAVATVA